MKYLVTGGAGFIGSHIVEYLANAHHEVIILDNLFSGFLKNIEAYHTYDNVSFTNGSITDIDLVRNICQDVDGIFHEAAIPSVPRSLNNPVATNDVNITGTLNLLVVARESGVKKIVYASSSSVYGDTPQLPKNEEMKPNPKSPYAVSKLAGEYYCRVFSGLYGIETVALRYFNVYGPRQDPQSQYSAVIPCFIDRIMNNESPVIYGDGSQTRDFTFVKDVVQANWKAMESGADGIFNVARGERISLLDLAETIMEQTGIRKDIIFADSRTGDVHDSLADISAAKKAFDYSPEYPLNTGIKETIRWFEENQ
jgi:UDP-glucose 4-epimerase